MTQTKYTSSKIAQITNGKLITSGGKNPVIRDLMIDSRHQVENPEESMFIALVSIRNDGHKYIRELVNRGVTCFLVSKGRAPGNQPLSWFPTHWRLFRNWLHSIGESLIIRLSPLPGVMEKP